MITKYPLSFICGALLGGAIGASAALILAPQPGTKMRSQLRSLILNGKRMSQKRDYPHIVRSHAINNNHHSKPKSKIAAEKRPRKKSL